MADYYVTVAGAGANTGVDWANAMTIAELETLIETTVVAGDNIWIAGGTYTCNSHFNSTRSGTRAAGISLIGVDSGTTAEPPTPSDWAEGTARPLFDFSGSSSTGLVWNGDYLIIRNMRISGQYTSGLLTLDDNCHAVNCYVQNTYTTGGAIYVGFYGTLYDCECVSDTYTATYGDGHLCLLNCYMHDSGSGTVCTSGVKIIGCIFDTCTTGISISSDSGVSIINNTIYNCTAGVLFFNSQGIFMLNNTIDTCTDGFIANYSDVPQTGGIVLDYNNWYNNTRDMSWDNGSTENNSSKGSNALNVDPGFTDAPNGNFTLQTDSALINAGFAIRLGVT